MKFLQSPIQYGPYPGSKFTPIEGSTNYLSITIFEVPEKDLEVKSETANTNETPEPQAEATKPQTIKKVVVFELKEGREINTKIQTRASKKKNPKIGDFFTFEEVVPQMVYQSEPIEDQNAVIRLEGYLLMNSI